MATVNKRPALKTHEGGRAVVLAPELELRRSVLSCLLWESEAYEDGVEISERIASLVPKVSPKTVTDLAIEARTEMNLRHVPLLLARELARKYNVSKLLPKIILRADELTEFMAIYWLKGKEPMANSVKKGLATAFRKFDEYQLAKYNRKGVVTLKDVLFMSHAKPKDEEQEALWKRLINDELASPQTWENRLSAGENKKEVWESMMKERRLGGMAFIRNLRNMSAENVNEALIQDYFNHANFSRIHPFRFISATRAAPRFLPLLENQMLKGITTRLPGKTKILVDVSGSMGASMSTYSDMNRMNAAFALAMILREMAEFPQVFTFSNRVVEVHALRGFGLMEAMDKSQPHGGTYLGGAVRAMEQSPYDRLIVISDEQSHDRVPDPKGNGYMINVASNRRGVGYGKWNHVDGFSDGVIRWIAELEGAC